MFTSKECVLGFSEGSRQNSNPKGDGESHPLSFSIKINAMGQTMRLRVPLYVILPRPRVPSCCQKELRSLIHLLRRLVGSVELPWRKVAAKSAAKNHAAPAVKRVRSFVNVRQLVKQ